MPLIKTHNKKLISETVHEQDRVIQYNDLENTINSIISTLIFEQPSLINDVDLGKVDKNVLKSEIIKLVDKHRMNFSRDKIISTIFDKLFGYGILQQFIVDEDISDIDFLRYNYVTYKVNGKKQKLDIRFKDEKEFENFCKLIIIRNGGIINENDSHCRVSDEQHRLRINVAIPPRNRTGACLIVRKHRHNPYTLDNLVELNMINHKQNNFLKEMIKDVGKNFLICGKGASGKTTLLRAILMEANPLANMLVCEKDTELYLNNYPNFIIQKIKKKEEGGKEITLMDLVKDGLTMSLDGICVGELIGEEAWDFINAGYTDHQICGTIHSISPEDTVERLITMIDIANLNISEQTIKTVIAGALDIIIYLKDFKLHKMVQVMDYNKKNDEFNFQDITETCKRVGR